MHLTTTKTSKLLSWFLIWLIIYEAISLLMPAINRSGADFFFFGYLSIFFAGFLLLKTDWQSNIPSNINLLIFLLFIINLIALGRGWLSVSEYLEKKKLITAGNGGLSLLVPLGVLVGINYRHSYRFTRICIILFKCSFIFIPVSLSFFPEIYSRVVVPVTFFILLLPYLKRRDQLIVVLVAFISVGIALGWRANILRIAAAFGMLGIYYFRNLISTYVLSVVQFICFVIPLFFLYKGIQGDSVFAKNAKAEYTISTKGGEEEDMTADTRTFLYEEVLEDMVRTKTLMFGKGASAKYTTYFFDDDIYVNGRDNVEVGILNILLCTGIVGVAATLIILVIAVFYGTRRSNNTLTKMLAVFLAFHWVMLFIENSIEFNFYNLFLWIAIGLCFSRSFRELSDRQIRYWLSNAADKVTYRKRIAKQKR